MKQLFLLVLCVPLFLSAFEPTPITPHAVVGYHEIPFHDRNQALDRTILVWYPVDPLLNGTPSESPWDLFYIAKDAAILNPNQKKPIIVYSHGYLGNPHQLSWLARGLVYGGYIVLAIQHNDTKEGIVHVNHWQRAQDVQTILNEFAQDTFSQWADLDKIGVSGFSLGGTTAIWTIGGRTTKLDTLIPDAKYASPEEYTKTNEALPTLNREMMAKDWRDARVKAAFIMAPAWAWIFDENSLRHISVPSYIVAGQSDHVIIPKTNAGFFAETIPNSKLNMIPGKSGHFVFVSALADNQKKQVLANSDVQFLFIEDASVDRNWVQYQTANEAVKFFNATLNTR